MTDEYKTMDAPDEDEGRHLTGDEEDDEAYDGGEAGRGLRRGGSAVGDAGGAGYSRARQDGGTPARDRSLYRVIADLFCGCCRSRGSLTIGSRNLRVLRRIGVGAYASVSAVEDVSTHEHFAIKECIVQEHEQLAAVQWEVEVHRRLGNDCPFLEPLLDFHVDQEGDGIHPIARFLLPLYRGSLQHSLDTFMTIGRFLDEAVALQRLAELCTAVLRFHQLDPPLAHRDIKPGNILLTATGQAVLADFGSTALARVRIRTRTEAVQLQEQAAQFSSMPYRAPELFDPPSDCTITEKTDIWSLGCTVYAMVYGYSPFECQFGDDGRPRVVECSYLRVIAGPQFPRVANPGSPALMELIKVMLKTNPDERPSAEQVLASLKAMGYVPR